jgi:carbonic anhydrase/acetyltransferase-like protein (isoleucine patch superfamily)
MKPTFIGNKVKIGFGAFIEGAYVEDECRIGEGAYLSNGSRMGKYSVLLAGSKLDAASTIPSGQVWGGIPAKFVRTTLPSDIEATALSLAEDRLLASAHARESAKKWLEVEDDAFNQEQQSQRDHDVYYRRLNSEVIEHED